jgi:hypothetical protein
VKERNHQFKIMARIYEAADLGLAWLRQSSPEMSLAITMLNILGTGLKKHGMILEWSESVPDLWYEDKERKYSSTWPAIHKFLILPYWFRIYTVQYKKLGAERRAGSDLVTQNIQSSPLSEKQ